MLEHYSNGKLRSSIFITFSGDCKKALRFYHYCFGGKLHFQTFENKLEGIAEMPVVSGSLTSERIIIHGSDLVHEEGRKLGNFMAVFLHCKGIYDRKKLIEKLDNKKVFYKGNAEDQKLIEITDAFDVRWILGV